MKQTDFIVKPKNSKFCALVLGITLLFGGAQADEWDAAQQVIQQATDELLRRMNMEMDIYSKDNQRRHQMLEEVILPVVDMETFSRLTLGRGWDSYNKEQKLDFIENFQSMLLRTYGKSMLGGGLGNMKIEYDLESRKGSGKYKIVSSRVFMRDGEESLDVSYSLINRDGWKVFDVIIDGTSLARQLRSVYAVEIQESGFDALLERLKKANAQQNQ